MEAKDWVNFSFRHIHPCWSPELSSWQYNHALVDRAPRSFWRKRHDDECVRTEPRHGFEGFRLEPLSSVVTPMDVVRTARIVAYSVSNCFTNCFDNIVPAALYLSGSVWLINISNWVSCFVTSTSHQTSFSVLCVVVTTWSSNPVLPLVTNSRHDASHNLAGDDHHTKKARRTGHEESMLWV